MRAGLPVLASPVGGPCERSSTASPAGRWTGLGADALRRALRRLLENRDEIAGVRASGAVFERFLRLSDPEEILAGVRELFKLDSPAGDEEDRR